MACVQRTRSGLNGGQCVKEKFRPDSLPGSKNAAIENRARCRFPRVMPAQAMSDGPAMPMSRHLCRLSLLAVLAGASAAVCAGPQARAQRPPREPPVQADRPSQQGHDRPAEQRALSDAVRRAERATRGQVLSAERVQYDGRDLNRVKVVDDRGRVRVYWDDPQTQPDRRDGDPPRGRRTHDDDGGSD